MTLFVCVHVTPSGAKGSLFLSLGILLFLVEEKAGEGVRRLRHQPSDSIQHLKRGVGICLLGSSLGRFGGHRCIDARLQLIFLAPEMHIQNAIINIQ
jgi:hypothetical protein